jgi:DNA-binding XRE family transcriptional regulator
VCKLDFPMAHPMSPICPKLSAREDLNFVLPAEGHLAPPEPAADGLLGNAQCTGDGDLETEVLTEVVWAHMAGNPTEVKAGYQPELRAPPTDKRAVWVTLNPMTFGERLKKARLAAGLTQQQLADACGLTNAMVSKCEAGLTDAVLAPNLFAMADVLKVDARWLMTGEDGERNDMSSLTPEQRAAVRALVSTMKK